MKRIVFSTAATASRSLLIIPIGSFEQHGQHLPLATDSLIAEILADALVELTGGTRTPAVPVTCSHEHHGLGLTLAVDAVAAFSYIDAIVRSGIEQGFAQVALVNAHGGNYFLGNLVQQHSAQPGQVYLGPDLETMEAAFAEAGIETSVSEDMHGGEYETSVLLAHCANVVDMSLAVDTPAHSVRLFRFVGLRAYTRSGVIGRPRLATSAKGHLVVSALARRMHEDLMQLADHRAQ